MCELSSEQVDYCEEVVIRPEPSCSGNCCLNLGVDRFSRAITHLMLVAVDDSIHMVSDGSSQPFEGRESGAACPADPLLQRLYWIKSRSCFSQYLSQPFFHSPGSGSLEAGTLQPVHHFKLPLIPVAGIFEGAPADPLEIALFLDLRSPHLFQRLIGQLDQMEGIKALIGLREMLSTARLITLGEIHGDRFDLLWIASMSLKILDEGGEYRLVSAPGGKQGATQIGIMKDGDVTQATDMLLINTNAAYALVALLFSGTIYNAVQRFPEAMIRHSQKVSNLSNRKLFCQGDGKGFKQQGKATTGVGPRHLNLSGLSTAAGNARKGCMDERLVLKEMKMLPGAGFSVMDGLIGFPTNRTRKAFLSTDHIKVDLPPARRQNEHHRLSMGRGAQEPR